MKKLILHHHIFKNAGSSIDHLLRHCFADRWTALEGVYPWSTIANDELFDHLDNRPHTEAISSHQARPLRQLRENYAVFPIIFLRHPIDRVGSCYAFERASQSSLPSSEAAKRGLPYYIDQCLGDDPGLRTTVFRDYQTLFLSSALDGIDDTRVATAEEGHLNEAIDYLSRLPVFGLVEEFDRSVDLFQSWLSPHFSSIQLRSVHINASNRTTNTLEQRCEELRETLGGQRFDRLLEANRLDLALYGFAKTTFPFLNPASRS